MFHCTFGMQSSRLIALGGAHPCVMFSLPKRPWNMQLPKLFDIMLFSLLSGHRNLMIVDFTHRILEFVFPATAKVSNKFSFIFCICFLPFFLQDDGRPCAEGRRRGVECIWTRRLDETFSGRGNVL